MKLYRIVNIQRRDMREFLCFVLLSVLIAGTKALVLDVETAKKGTYKSLYFHFPVMGHGTYCRIFTPHVLRNFFVRTSFIKLKNGLTMEREKNTWKVNIQKVSSEDVGRYGMTCRNHENYELWMVSRELILHLIDENSFSYNDTVLLKNGSPYTLKIVNEIPLQEDGTLYIIRYNFSSWVSFLHVDRFLLFRENGKFVFKTDNMTTGDEGIYHLMYQNFHPKRSIKEIMAIRFLVKELHFTKQVHQNITFRTEGEIIPLVCEIFGSLDVKSLTIESSDGNVESNNQTRISYHFLARRRDHLSHFTCKADLLNYPTTIVTETLLIVYYPPSVQIRESDDKTSLECMAHGYPDNYKYYWTRNSESSDQLQNITGLSNGTLLIQVENDQRHQNVTYTCYASNGIRDIYGQMYQKDIFILFEGRENSILETEINYQNVIIALVVIFCLSIAVISMVCCSRKNKKTAHSHDMHAISENEEIGTMNNHSNFIQPMLPQLQVPDHIVSVELVAIGQTTTNIENIYRATQLQQIYDASIDEEIIESNSIQRFRNENHVSGSVSSDHTSGDEAQGTSIEQAVNEYEHAYTQPLPIQDEHSYSDYLDRYINNTVREHVEKNKKQDYINLHVWED